MKGSRVLSGEFYTSKEIFAKEKEKFIYENPICVGHVSDIPNPDNYFLYEVDGESIIVFRDENGGVKALHNVCPHRNIRLMEEPHNEDRGHRDVEITEEKEEKRLNKVIQCDYHSITFDKNGKVINAMALEETEGFEREELCIQESAVHVWNGFIFINVDPNRPMNFEEAFPYLPTDLDKYGLGELELGAEIVYNNIPANWKIIFENYEECDHCPTKHPQLIRVSGYKSWFNDVTEGPVLGGYMLVKEGYDDLTISGEFCAPLLGDFKEDEVKRLYAYSFSPGMLLLGVHPDYVNYDLIVPISENKTKIISRWLFRKDAAKFPGYNPKDAVDFWDLTNKQDFLDICARVQKGAGTRFLKPGPLSSKESLVAAFDRDYLRVMGLKQLQQDK